MPLGFLFVWRGIEKKNKKRLNFWLTLWKELKFQLSVCVCADIFVTQLKFGIVVWTK